MMRVDFIQLSKAVSHALRHEPQSYNLDLDSQGWASLVDLVAALNFKGIEVDEKTIIEMVDRAEKRRHQISEGKIRANYGHSVETKIIKYPLEPPKFLYHGTIKKNVNNIMVKGLLPMNRQYVHLSFNEEIAETVASRKKGDLAIVKVNSQEAYKDGIQFYNEENGIWLANSIPSKYLIL